MLTIRTHSRNLLLAMAVLLTAVVGANQAAADRITVDTNSLAIYAGKAIWIDKESEIQGDIASGKSISTGATVTLRSAYTEGFLWLDRDNSVRGSVLANGYADAGRGLDFQGSSWTGNSVYVGRGAAVTGDIVGGSGLIGIDREAQVAGSVLGNNNIWIDRNSTVDGDASPGLGKRLSTGSNVTISGSRSPANVVADTFELPDLPGTPAKGSYGSQSIYRGNNTVMTLAPGSYRNLSMWGNNTTLNVSAGTYTLRQFWIGDGGVVNVDTAGGDVIFNAHKDFDTGNSVKFNKTGGGDLIVNLFDNSIWLGQDTAIEAKIRVWDGGFAAARNLKLRGSIWADDHVTIARNSLLYFNTVPEPASAATLLLGMGILLRRRTRFA